MSTIPFLDLQAVNAPFVDEINEAIAEVISCGRYIRGNAVAQFERNYGDYIGTQHCVGVSNGLDALTLIYRAYIEMGRLQKGDEVIVPANTYIASILAVTANGLIPVLVEPDERTLQIETRCVERAISERTRSVMLVHLYGRCSYSEEMAVLCKRHGLILVEDNAQAHGCEFEGRKTGSLGHAAGHSFYPTKNLGAMGDAGAVTTDDEQLATVVRSLANYGSKIRYQFDYEGRNCRLDEVQAAVLNVKLRYLDAMNARRRELADIYYSEINHPGVWLPEKCRDKTNVYHLFPVLSSNRDQLRQMLSDVGIHTDVHYPIPPHRQPALKPLVTQLCKAEKMQPLPVTEKIHREELSLPLNTAMTDEQAEYICRMLNSFS